MEHRRVYSPRCFQDRLFSSFVRSAPILLSENRRSKTQSIRQKEARQRKANSASEKPWLSYYIYLISPHETMNGSLVSGYSISGSELWVSCQLCTPLYFVCYPQSKFSHTQEVLHQRLVAPLSIIHNLDPPLNDKTNTPSSPSHPKKCVCYLHSPLVIVPVKVQDFNGSVQLGCHETIRLMTGMSHNASIHWMDSVVCCRTTVE